MDDILNETGDDYELRITKNGSDDVHIINNIHDSNNYVYDVSIDDVIYQELYPELDGRRYKCIQSLVEKIDEYNITNCNNTLTLLLYNGFLIKYKTEELSEYDIIGRINYFRGPCDSTIHVIDSHSFYDRPLRGIGLYKGDQVYFKIDEEPYEMWLYDGVNPLEERNTTFLDITFNDFVENTVKRHYLREQKEKDLINKVIDFIKSVLHMNIIERNHLVKHYGLYTISFENEAIYIDRSLTYKLYSFEKHRKLCEAYLEHRRLFNEYKLNGKVDDYFKLKPYEHKPIPAEYGSVNDLEYITTVKRYDYAKVCDRS